MKTRTNQSVTDYDGLLDEVVAQSNTNGIKVFEDIKDKDGHARFIEDNIDIVSMTGVSKTYGKWTLSGSHLLIVVGIDIENATTTTAGRIVDSINIPNWIKDKLVPLYGANNIAVEVFNGYADNGTTQNVGIYFGKDNNNKIYMYMSSITTTALRHFRFVFDFLIDNE